MKFIKLILLHIVSLSLINLWALSITSATYNAGTNVMTITFSDSINTDSVSLGRLSLDDDYGGPNTDVVFTGGANWAWPFQKIRSDIGCKLYFNPSF